MTPLGVGVEQAVRKPAQITHQIKLETVNRKCFKLSDTISRDIESEVHLCPLVDVFVTNPVIKSLVIIVACLSIAAMPAKGEQVLKPLTPLVAPEFLPVDEAFRISVKDNQDYIEIQWQIAPGYYLYRDKLSFSVDLEPEMISGITKDDKYFGKVEVYYHELVVNLPLSSGSVPNEELLVGFQGCAEAGLCYPPQKQVFSF